MTSILTSRIDYLIRGITWHRVNPVSNFIFIHFETLLQILGEAARENCHCLSAEREFDNFSAASLEFVQSGKQSENEI